VWSLLLLAFRVGHGVMLSLKSPTADTGGAACRVKLAVLNLGVAYITFVEQVLGSEKSLLNPGIVTGEQAKGRNF